jgi:integral membrane protein (TIGR01906 family)
MKNKKLFVFIVSILMILTIPFIIYGYNFNSVTFDENFHKKEFSKYKVYANLKNYDVESINSAVLNYLKFGKNNNLINNDFFNEREKTHLLDVKNLIQTIFNIYYFLMILIILLIITLIILLNFNLEKIAKKLLIILIIGSSLVLLDAVLFFILSNLNFDFVFDLFHNTFFISGTFTFNPESENIVVLYPENLFFDFLIKIISNTIFSSIIILFFSILFIFIFFKPNFLKFFQKSPTGKTKNKSFKYYFCNKIFLIK